LVYKKYIERNGKIYGPYVYNSKRVNGKVISEYIGTEKPKESKKILPLVILSISIVAVGALLIFLNRGISGNVIFNVQGNVINGSLSNGKLNLVVNEGELIPASSQIVIENNGSSQTYNLSDLLSGESMSQGDFYLQGSQVSGSGQGYGLQGQEIIYPTVSFKIELLNASQNQTANSSLPAQPGSSPPTGSNNSSVRNSSNKTNQSNLTAIQKQTTGNNTISNNTNQTVVPNSSGSSQNNTAQKQNHNSTNAIVIPSNTSSNAATQNAGTTPAPARENLTAQPPANTEPNANNQSPSQSTQNPPTEPSSSAPQNSSSSITGSVITSFITGLITGNSSNSSIISGQASSGNDFSHNSNGRLGVIVPGSVKSGSKNLSDNEVSIRNSGKNIIVSTNYSMTQNGYGAAFTGSGTKIYSIDLSKLSQQIKEGSLKVKLIYNGSEIASFSETISNSSIQATIANNKTNTSTLESSNISMNLTESEIKILLSYVNLSSVSTAVSKYKDKYLVDFKYGPYNAEYSYPQNLSDNELQTYLERDKTLWLKDIANSLQETSPRKTLIGNMSGNYNL
jgi:hypothetical protein